MDFYRRKIIKVEALTNSSSHFYLEKIVGEDYLPGQFIQIQVSLDGNQVLREYSLTSLPEDDFLSFAVKKVSNEGVSAFLNDNSEVLSELETTAPRGNFILPIKPNEKRTLVFFAAGSGITPIYAHIKNILQHESGSQVYLFYGNKTAAETMFKKELEILQQSYPENFFPYFIYSREKVGNPLFEGRIDAHKLELYINQILEWDEVDEVMICGPEEMIRELALAVNKMGIPKEHIHYEVFGALTEPIFPIETISTHVPDSVEVTFELYGQENTISWKPGESDSLLDAILDAGFDAPYSCKGGVCGTCMCQLLEGELAVDENIVLTDSDIEKGYRLTCAAIPVSDKIKLKLEV